MDAWPPYARYHAHPHDGRTLEVGVELGLVAAADCLHFHSPEPLRTLSNALIGEGLGWSRDFCNFHVDKDYAGQAPADDLRRWLAARGLVEDSSLAMMTAVPLTRLALVPVEFGTGEAGRVLVAATAGVGNAVDICAPALDDPRLVAGTINLLVFIDAHLTDGALVNAALSASEAKVQALAACGVRDPEHGTPATGTSTDCLAIAATQQGKPTPYAGSGTHLGRAIGTGVFHAVSESLAAGQEAS